MSVNRFQAKEGSTMEMTCKPLIAEASKPDQHLTLDKEQAFDSEFSLLSMITRLESLVGLQRSITLCAESPKEMVRALRFHPRYEHLSMKELLNLVRKRAGSHNSMRVKLSEKLVPVFSAVLQAEGIDVVILEADLGR